jgi:predicted negative regulator of RcsB-dependent stress response
MNRKRTIALMAIYTFVVAFAIIHWMSWQSNGYVLIVDTTTIIQSILAWLILFGFRYRSEKAHERENQ